MGGGGDNRPPQGQKIKNSAKLISHHQKKGRERIILKVLSSSTGPPHVKKKNPMEMSFGAFFSDSSLKLRLNHVESKIAKKTIRALKTSPLKN